MRTITVRAVVLALVLAVPSLACSSGETPRVESGAPWELRTAVDPATSVVPISVYVGSSSCDEFESVGDDESADTVTITARVHSAPATAACTSDLVLRQVDVSLSEPLGDRRIEGCGARPGFPNEMRDCRLVPDS